jgi:hypothetical protein
MADVEAEAGTSKPAKSTVVIQDLPRTTSQWNSEPEVVFKLFKVRSCFYNAETILWPNDRNGINIRNWRTLASTRTNSNDRIGYDSGIYFKFLDEVLQGLDIDESSWRKKPGNGSVEFTENELVQNTKKIYGGFNCSVTDFIYKPNAKDALVINKVKKELLMISRNINYWLSYIRSVLATKERKFPEMFYEESFRHFIDIVDMRCK